MNTHLQPHMSVPAQRSQRGFTLIELMVVVSILGILLSLTGPSMAAFVDSVRLSSTTNNFLASLRLARSESFKRGIRVAVCKSADGVKCSDTGGWEQGWVTFVDRNSNGQIDGDEKILERVEPLASAIRFTGNQNVERYLGFTAGTGIKTPHGGFAAGTLTLCHISSSSAEAHQIVISSGGRPRVQVVKGGMCG